MIENTFWHPVAQASEVVAAPLGVPLPGQPVVPWRDPQGQVRAFLDRGPHRGARRSTGRVDNGHLGCPCHGLADFDSPDERLPQFQHTLFCQDPPVLESLQPPCLPLDPRAEMHSAADRLSSAYRRYLKASGITFGVC